LRPELEPLTKRLFDLLLASSFLLCVSPVIVICAALIALTDRHAPFIRVSRMKTINRSFQMWKLRTMRGSDDGAPTSGAKSHRITPMGKLLRRYRLDELPQLWNVVIGDMSLVGPRPLSRGTVIRFARDYEELLTLRPGLTGLGTVTLAQWEDQLLSSVRDPKDAQRIYETEVMPNKLRIERSYLRTRTLRLDMKILAATFHVILERNGVKHKNGLSNSVEIEAGLCS
jgi:lipopolysaccharide/colanic/teichoic acid biosynthesis glycosyltransferase